MSHSRIDDLLSRYANCTPGVLAKCIRTVAEEGSLDGVIPQFEAREVALVACNALDAFELEPRLRELCMVREVRTSDWALAILAEFRFMVARQLRQERKEAPAEEMWELASLALEDAAASSDRSPVLWYEDIYFEAAQSLVRRGDRTGIVRQIECVAETLRSQDGVNAVGAMRDLGRFYLDLGDHRLGLALLAALQRHDPSDMWSYNAIALELQHCGLPSLARLAAERGIQLVEQKGDSEGLSKQLAEVIRNIGSKKDTSDAPGDAVDDLRDALNGGFEKISSEAPADLARRLVPEISTARGKQPPPMPTPEVLASTAARLREILKAEDGPAERGSPVLTRPPAQVPHTAGPKVGRNDPCPCGSGRKFKKCCGK